MKTLRCPVCESTDIAAIGSEYLLCKRCTKTGYPEKFVLDLNQTSKPAYQLQGQTIELAWLEPNCLNLVMVGSRDIIKVIGYELTIQVQKAEEVKP